MERLKQACNEFKHRSLAGCTELIREMLPFFPAKKIRRIGEFDHMQQTFGHVQQTFSQVFQTFSVDIDEVNSHRIEAVSIPFNQNIIPAKK